MTTTAPTLNSKQVYAYVADKQDVPTCIYVTSIKIHHTLCIIYVDDVITSIRK
jgi:hypothetical protein